MAEVESVGFFRASGGGGGDYFGLDTGFGECLAFNSGGLGVVGRVDAALGIMGGTLRLLWVHAVACLVIGSDFFTSFA